MSNHSIHIKRKYVSSPSYRKEHSLTYKLFMSFVVLLIGAAVIIGGVAVN
jgi:hypothetical protein